MQDKETGPRPGVLKVPKEAGKRALPSALRISRKEATQQTTLVIVSTESEKVQKWHITST